MICAGLYNVYLLLLFRSNKHRSATVAKLVNIKTTKNARVRKEGSKMRTKTVPHLSTGTYTYEVNGKEYQLTGWQASAPGQLPKMPRVVYLTRHPRHAYLDCEMMYLPEILHTMIWLMLGICTLCGFV